MATGRIDEGRDREYKERAAAQAAAMTLEEKILQMVHGAAENTRLGIPAYNWWNEALHGVARAGVATVFPQAIALAATFDPGRLQEVADAISTEGRAKYHHSIRLGDRDIYKGLTFWSPNINLFRDPRWGRGHETYGEDPYLTAELGKAFVRGIQGDDPRYLKAAACAKHFAVHSGPEGDRHHFDARVSDKDLFESYLPAFEACVREARVEAVMGAYNRVGGEPCCGHSRLLRDILRGAWGFDGHVVSDCWAIKDFHEGHRVTGSMEESAALAVRMGCDLNCGGAFLVLQQAVEAGLLSEADIDRALVRLLTARMRLGMFDDDFDAHPYARIPYDRVDCPEHRALNLETAEQSVVLLRNNGILPLAPGGHGGVRRIAVIGPNADSRPALLGNYNGTPSDSWTLLRGILEVAGPEIDVRYAKGAHICRESDEPMTRKGALLSEARIVAEMADLVVLCIGLDPTLEGEEGDAGNAYASGDKPDLSLPESQRPLLAAMLETGKPLVLVVVSGSALAIPEADGRADAILQVFYPGAMGGLAVARVLFGLAEPGGRLPVTFYRTSGELPDFREYAMAGRTYRYMENEALYPFGYGLSYSRIEYGDLVPDRTEIPAAGAEPLRVSATVRNTGDRVAREVVQLYVRRETGGPAGVALPRHWLRGIRPIRLDPGESRTVAFELTARDLSLCDASGTWILPPGRLRLFVGSSQPDGRSVALLGRAPLEALVTITS